MEWIVKITGNMTLAIVDGKRVVARVDMLRQNTMKAGDDGKKLCRAINDLTLIANYVNCAKNMLPYDESIGISPLPWKVIRSNKCFSIYDNAGKIICYRNISRKNFDKITNDFEKISSIIEIICKE